MSDTPYNSADVAAERILAEIYGDDLTGCAVSIGSISAIISEATAEVRARDQLVIKMLVEVIEKIQLIATPPERNEIHDAGQLAAMLGERADGIREITAEALAAFEKINGKT